jgi:hypothetical protein
MGPMKSDPYKWLKILTVITSGDDFFNTILINIFFKLCVSYQFKILLAGSLLLSEILILMTSYKVLKI